MDENFYTEQKMTYEIELRDLFLILWKKKVFIICITFIAAIITGIISVFFITPVYHSSLNIIINMPETYHTKYGDYSLPITTNDQYINLITSNEILVHTIKDMGYDNKTTIESLRDRITIDNSNSIDNVEQNSFNIKIAANNPEEARKLAQTLFNNYLEFLDLLTVEGAVDYYIDKYIVDVSTLEDTLERTKEILAKNEALLAEIPQTINQKEAMDEIDKSPKISDFVILENVINPNYTEIENDIIENKQSINSIENSIKTYNHYLNELKSVKESIKDYKVNGNWNLEDEFKSITKTNIYLPSAPIAPSRKSSPSNLKNMIIGAV